MLLLMSTCCGACVDSFSGVCLHVQDVPSVRGSVVSASPIAYVSQTPWALNASVKDNILFDEPLFTSRYKDTIKACGLMWDLQQWASGEDTIVGDQGSTLSGGQRQRLALARAVYSPAPLLLMDDVLSAVGTCGLVLDVSMRARIFAHKVS